MPKAAAGSAAGRRSRQLARDWPRLAFTAATLLLVAGAFLAPPMPFIDDGGLYYDMARAMADHGVLHIAQNGGVEGAPPLVKWLTSAHEGKVYAQYPAGYALVAAPFYKLFGIHGLMLLNALSAAAALAMTYRLSKTLYAESGAAMEAAALLGVASFLSYYAFTIWPQALGLSLYLGATLLAVEGVTRSNSGTAWKWLAASGLLIGFGVSIRIDVILTLPAILIWLRLFALPANRLAAGAVFLGTIPGLGFSAFLNWLKYGVPSPISYGPAGGNTDPSAYTAIAIAVTVGLTVLMLADLKKLAAEAYRRRPLVCLIGGGAVAALIVTFCWPIISPLLRGAWVLVFNLQALQQKYFQPGVGYDEYGRLLFWGFPKRAFTQSVPFAALIVIPVIAHLRGKRSVALALCLLAIAAPIAFYALHEWHGGGSYNIRYFLPALPFVSILAAQGARRLYQQSGLSPKTAALTGALLAIVGFTTFDFAHSVAMNAPQLRTPSDLYPQSLFFCVLVILSMLAVMAPGRSQRLSGATLLFAAFVVGYSASVNFSDEFAQEKTRAAHLDVSRIIGHALPRDALVLGDFQILFIDAEARGLSFMAVWNDTSAAAAAEAARAFASAGRCVYIQNETVRERMTASFPENAMTKAPEILAPDRYPDKPYLKFFGLISQRPECALLPTRTDGG